MHMARGGDAQGGEGGCTCILCIPPGYATDGKHFSSNPTRQKVPNPGHFLFRFIEAGFLATSRTVTLNTELKDSAYFSEKFQFGFRWDIVVAISGIIRLGSQQNKFFFFSYLAMN